jgi:hypothetical protein
VTSCPLRKTLGGKDKKTLCAYPTTQPETASNTSSVLHYLILSGVFLHYRTFDYFDYVLCLSCFLMSIIITWQKSSNIIITITIIITIMFHG